MTSPIARPSGTRAKKRQPRNKRPSRKEAIAERRAAKKRATEADEEATRLALQKQMITRGQSEPIWWTKAWMGADPWEKQAEIMQSVCDNEVTAVPSCHAAGKDWDSAHIACWFLYNHPNSLVVTTAPTSRQVRHILWKEIGAAIEGSKHPLGGRLLTTHLELDRKWFAIGFTSNEWNPDKFMGYHAPYVLVIVDEASGVADNIFESIDSLLSSGYKRRLLLIGNPTNPVGEFRQRCADPDTNTIRISAFDTPNFTATGVKQADIESGAWRKKVERYVAKHGSLPRPYLVDPAYAAGVFKRHGANSPSYLARVLAKFPSESPDTLIPLANIALAREVALKVVEDDIDELACDVARFGQDRTVIMHRKGPRVRTVYIGEKKSNTETAGKLIQLQREYGAKRIKVDDDGVGGGVTDILVEHFEDNEDVEIIPLHNGSTKELRDPARFKNCRSEWAWNLRLLFESGAIDIDDDEDLEHEISVIRYKNDSAGKIWVLPKDEIKADLGKSPDLFDTLMYAYADPKRRKKTKIRAMDFGSSRPSNWIGMN